MFNKIYQILCKASDYAFIVFIIMACLSMILHAVIVTGILTGDKFCKKGETHNYIRYMDTRYLYCTKCLTLLEVDLKATKK